MTDAILEVNASSSDIDVEREFDRLYSELNAARSAFFAPNADGSSGEEEAAHDAAIDRYELAKRTFVAMPAPR